MTDDTTVVLSAEGLVAGYVPGVNILNGCDLVLHESELVGVIGPVKSSCRHITPNISVFNLPSSKMLRNFMIRKSFFAKP